MLLKLCICVAITVSALLPWDELWVGAVKSWASNSRRHTCWTTWFQTGAGPKPESLKALEMNPITHALKLGNLFNPGEVLFSFSFFFSSPMNAYRARNCSLCFPGWEWEFYVWVLLVYLIREQLPKWKVQPAHLMWTAHVIYTFKKRHFQTSNYSML